MAIIDKLNKVVSMAVQGSSTEDWGTGGFRKCPSCGNPISGMDAVCPMCGCSLGMKASQSVGELAKELEKIERKRNAVADSLAVKLSGRSIAPTDEKIISLIRNYIVPNTKEDIVEFMLFAAGHIDAKVLAGRTSDDSVCEAVVKAWESKFQQAFQKASLSFGSDPDFPKIQSVYDSKMWEIEKEKPRSMFAWRK